MTQRDDATNHEVALKVAAGKYGDAIRLLTGRRFAVWEGGTLNVSELWVDAHLLKGREHLAARRYREALSDFRAAAKIPDNLPSEQMGGGANPEISYWMGAAYEGLGQTAGARQAWMKAAQDDGSRSGERRRRGGGGLSPFAARVLSRTRPPGLDPAEKAEAVFRSLVEAGNKSLEEGREAAPKASFDAHLSARARLANAGYVAALGHLGLGDRAKAAERLKLAVAAKPDHAQARFLLARGVSDSAASR